MSFAPRLSKLMSAEKILVRLPLTEMVSPISTDGSMQAVCAEKGRYTKPLIWLRSQVAAVWFAHGQLISKT